MAYGDVILAEATLTFYARTFDGSSVDAKAGLTPTYTGSPTTGVSTGLPGFGTDAGVTFNSSTQHVTFPSNAANNPADVFAVEMWVKRSTTGSDQGVVSKGGSTVGAFFIDFSAADEIRLIADSTANVWISVETLTNTTNWHHIVMNKNGAAVTAYLDGVALTQGSFANQTLETTTLTLCIGADQQSGGSFNEFYVGSVAALAIYNTPLSGSQVSAHFAAATTSTLPPGLKMEMATQSAISAMMR